LEIKLGDAAKELRKSLGIKQREAAVVLGVSDVHLCNIEKNRAIPSPQLLEKYREVWGIDLYVFAWCMYGDETKLPANMRKAAATLLEGWKKQIKEATLKYQTE
jgi:transcriptional regulator with XRE-family HTH domain